jgi:hypothetical protein
VVTTGSLFLIIKVSFAKEMFGRKRGRNTGRKREREGDFVNDYNRGRKREGDRMIGREGERERERELLKGRDKEREREREGKKERMLKERKESGIHKIKNVSSEER